jgi:hypothetical protein
LALAAAALAVHGHLDRERVPATDRAYRLVSAYIGLVSFISLLTMRNRRYTWTPVCGSWHASLSSLYSLVSFVWARRGQNTEHIWSVLSWNFYFIFGTIM